MDLDELLRIARESRSPQDEERLWHGIRTVLLTDLRPRSTLAEDVEDIVQESLVIVLRKLPKFTLRWPGALRAWVLIIGRHRAADYQRRLARTLARQEPLTSRGADGIAASSTGPFTGFVRAEKDSALRRFLDELRPSERETLMLKLVGYTEQEIAEIEGISTRAVRKRMDRLLASPFARRLVARFGG